MATTTEILRPPEPPGALTWIRRNLFNNWYNTLITLLVLPTTGWVLFSLIRWVIVTANWEAVSSFPLLYLVGQYPRDQLFRVAVILWVSTFMFGVSWGVWGKLLRTFAVSLGIMLGLAALFPTPAPSYTLAIRIGLIVNPGLIYLGYLLGRRGIVTSRQTLIAWVVLYLVTPLLLTGNRQVAFLPSVTTTLWGGVLVTLLLAVGGITLSFPIGVALALGRRSGLPVVRIFSTMFIELVRGVPLVTILFMFSIILALFLPEETRIDRLIRALMAMTFFSAAYTAENVRGGLQAIPQGQSEAAKAIGLNNLQTMVFIILPQALRAVIPAIVGQFISLFKDTTLAVIVGINELLNIGKSILNSDPKYVGDQAEVYIFIAAVFWIFSYLMSNASRQLETSLGVGER